MDKVYVAIDLKSFYASVECMERGLDPLNTNLVVADLSRTEKTIYDPSDYNISEFYKSKIISVGVQWISKSEYKDYDTQIFLYLTGIIG